MSTIALRRKRAERLPLQERDRLILEYLDMARRVTRLALCGNGGEEVYEEVLGAAYFALVECARTYRPGGGKKFSSYAIPRLLSAVRRELLDHPILPYPTLLRRGKLIRQNELYRESGLDESWELRPEELRFLFRWIGDRCPIEEETEDDQEGAVCLSDPSPRPDEIVERRELAERVQSLLTPLEMRILGLIACENLRIPRVAEILGIPRKSVALTLSKVRQRLKELFH